MAVLSLMRLSAAFRLLWQAALEWLKDDASFLAAALAYFGVFSLVPLFILILTVINAIFSQSLLGVDVVKQVQDIAAHQAPRVAGDMIDRAGERAVSSSFTLLSVLTMVFGAAGLFVQTKRSLKIIWQLPDEDMPALDTVFSYLVSFVLIALVALLLLSTSIVTAFLLPLGQQVEDMLPIHLGLLRVITFAVSFAFVTVLFAITYKTLGGAELGWRDVFLGSALASMLFAVGNLIIEAYVAIVDIGSAYGAAGSLVVFLFWIYYSAQIFLFGAELIKVHKRLC